MISNDHGLFPSFGSDRVGLTGLLGDSSEPKTFHAGADRKGGLCQAQVGTRVQGFLGLERWIHEPPGTPLIPLEAYLPFSVALIGFN